MFEYAFMQYALISGSIIAIICGIVSFFVIARRTAFAAHALGHISLTGASAAILVGISAISGQLIMNIISAIIMGLMGEKIKKNDLAIGIVLTFFLGLGAYFLYLYQNSYAGSVMTILFGNILAVSPQQIWVLLILAFIVLIGLVVIARPLLFSSIDPTIAEAKKIPQKTLSVIFFVLLAITVSMACQIVGALLVFALLIGPGAIAAQWCGNFYHSLIASIVIALTAVWLSLAAAFYLNLPTSFCITMLITVFYLIGLIKSIIQKHRS